MKVADARVFLGLLVSSYRPRQGLDGLRRIRLLVKCLDDQLIGNSEPDAPVTIGEIEALVAVEVISEMLGVAEINGRSPLSPGQSIPLLNILEELSPNVASA